jgi:prolyl oligopeptidase
MNATNPVWTRRRTLAAFGSLPAAMLVPSLPAWAAKAASAPPVARVAPVSETLWGETIVDPYRWMEDAKDRDWEPFMKGWAAHTRGVLDAIPGRKALAERIGKLSGDLPIANAPQVAGGRLFYELRPKGASVFKLYMREGAGGAEKLLVDPSTMKGEGGTHMSLDWWVPSPDGRYVVHGLSAAGSEDSTAQILDVNSGQLLPERIDRTQYAGPSWLPDSSGFFFMRLAEGTKAGAPDRYLDGVAWLHRLRTDPKDDQRVFARGLHPNVVMQRNEFPFVGADPSASHVLAGVFGGVRRENVFFTAPLADVLAGKAQWKQVCTLEDEVTGFAVRGDELFLHTTRGAPNAKVLKTSMAAPDIARAATVVPEGPAALEAIAVARDGLYLRDMDGGYGALRRLGNDGRVTPVALPFEGSIEGLSASTSNDGLWFAGTSWLLPQSVFRVDGKQAVEQVALAPAGTIDTSGYEAIRSFATARDGTKVPLSIIAKKGLRRDGRNPTLVNAYGSYQYAFTPYFNARGLAFLEQGGVLAVAHVRGGGEYGKRWWKAGQKIAKPNTWRDLIDACEALVKERWTSPRHLAIQGGSAGGITVGRALTERPDLFAAVISNVGVHNALRAEFSPNGPPNIDEFGTVTERAGFLGLKQMDATQAVRANVRYPAVLLTTGMTDPRVEPWQVAKMAARLQAVAAAQPASGRNPVLMRVEFDAGHGLGSTREQRDAERADEYSFVLWRTGHPGFQPRKTS